MKALVERIKEQGTAAAPLMEELAELVENILTITVDPYPYTKEFKISSAGAATFIAETPILVTDENVQALICDSYGPDTYHLTAIEKIPAGTPFILKSINGGAYTASLTLDPRITSADKPNINYLSPVEPNLIVSNGVTEDEKYEILILANGSNGVGFYPLEANTNVAAKVWLKLPNIYGKKYIPSLQLAYTAYRQMYRDGNNTYQADTADNKRLLMTAFTKGSIIRPTSESNGLITLLACTGVDSEGNPKFVPAPVNSDGQSYALPGKGLMVTLDKEISELTEAEKARLISSASAENAATCIADVYSNMQDFAEYEDYLNYIEAYDDTMQVTSGVTADGKYKVWAYKTVERFGTLSLIPWDSSMGTPWYNTCIKIPTELIPEVASTDGN